MYRTLLLLAALVPITVFGANVDLDRESGAQVVSDGTSYVPVAVHAPELSSANDWQDDALTVTHHAASSQMDVVATLVDDQGRFSLPNGEATLNQGESHVLEIADSDHSTGTFSVTLRVTLDFKDQGSVGGGLLERTVQVVVS